MLIGILAGLAAGALWGLTFIAPHIVAPYTPFDLTVARFGVFGLTSLVVLALMGRHWVLDLNRRDWQLLVALGFSGNAGYYLAMALAVPKAGTAIVALVIGALPVLMPLLGVRGKANAAETIRALKSPLAAIALGLLIVNGEAVMSSPSPSSRADLLVGVALALVALVLWTWYGLRNSSALAEYPDMDPAVWAALTGLGTVVAMVPLLVVGPLLGLSNVPKIGLTAADFGRLLLWGAILGVLASWGATWAWSICSQRLPVALAGQLIVSETLFALIYGFIYERRWPTLVEAAGSALLIAGVVAGIRAFNRQQSHHEI
jgi:drug/metabolite transporter (DMT)-like permease